MGKGGVGNWANLLNYLLGTLPSQQHHSMSQNGTFIGTSTWCVWKHLTASSEAHCRGHNTEQIGLSYVLAACGSAVD